MIAVMNPHSLTPSPLLPYYYYYYLLLLLVGYFATEIGHNFFPKGNDLVKAINVRGGKEWWW